MTVNPVTAAIVGAIVLDEALHWTLLVGSAAVAAGIRIATTASTESRSAQPD